MIVLDEKRPELSDRKPEKASGELETRATPTAVRSAVSGSSSTTASDDGKSKRRSFGGFFAGHFVDITLTAAIFMGLVGFGGFAFNGAIYDQQRSMMALYAQNISKAIDSRTTELPASTRISGEFSDVTGGAVSLTDPESGEVIAKAAVTAEPEYGDAARSFKVHGTVNDYTVDYGSSKDPSVVYHLDSRTDEVTKTTESKGLR